MARESMRSHLLPNGVELLEARLDRHIYERHIHDMHAIGITLGGVQRFWCRGATRDSLAGNVIVINPGEVHDGRSGTSGPYLYRMLYVPAERIAAIVRDAGSSTSADPNQPVIDDAALGRQVSRAWSALDHRPESLAADELFGQAVVALGVRHGGLRPRREERPNVPMLERAHEYLHAHLDANVRVAELTMLTSMSRFQLTRQFQRRFGLPLHAYHLHLRLEEAKRRILQGAPTVQIAADLGFCDQSHLHRRFRGAFGMTPDQWRRCTRIQDPAAAPA